MIPNPHLETPHYDIERIKDGNEKQTSSHQLITTPEIEATVVLKEKPVMEQPAVTGIAPIAPAPIIKPVAAAERKPSLLKRLLGVLTGAPVEEPDVNKPASVVKETDVEKETRNQNRRSRGRNNTNRRNNNRPRRPENAAGEEEKNIKPAEASTKVATADEKPAVEVAGDEKARNPNAKRSRRG